MRLCHSKIRASANELESRARKGRRVSGADEVVGVVDRDVGRDGLP